MWLRVQFRLGLGWVCLGQVYPVDLHQVPRVSEAHCGWKVSLTDSPLTPILVAV